MNFKVNRIKKKYLLWRLVVPGVCILISLVSLYLGFLNPTNPFETIYIFIIVVLYFWVDERVMALINKEKREASNETQTNETEFELFGSLLVLAITPGRTTIETEDYILTIVGEIPIIKKGSPILLCKKTKQVKIRNKIYPLVS